jgi:hypothetical protein
VNPEAKPGRDEPLFTSSTMIRAESFEMIETLTREALEAHPVWTHYEEPRDREAILSWGVPVKALDDEIARYEYCGPQPLYPVLQLDPLPRKEHLIVAAVFDAACGIELSGYVLEPHAFGLFVGDRELCFNRNLVGLSARAAGELESALGEEIERLFPIRYATGLRRHDGSRIEGEIERFW